MPWAEATTVLGRMLSAAESQVETLAVVTQTLGGKALSTLEKRLRQVRSFLRGPCLAGATACNIGHTEAATLGAHSCKVTRLAWAAKYGLSKDARTRWGNHYDRGSAECYGRDTLAAPLRDLEEWLLPSRSREFAVGDCPTRGHVDGEQGLAYGAGVQHGLDADAVEHPAPSPSFGESPAGNDNQ